MLNRLCAALCSWLIMFFTLIRFLHLFRPLNTIRSNVILVISLIGIFGILNSYLVAFLRYENQKQILDSDLTTTTSTQIPWHFSLSTSQSKNLTSNLLKLHV
ncbi:unnamed protein product [Didymodactylos carnosus]|uniref:Uncharacterized protein n=1 Tax=Didymodactylos carnosus TaxID=1234261 RepID=A0A815KV37_9BILA|nr:unnamed protein product [Didymodactylos carnosus]CAF4294603.1 unnamed protein product [Didymodactylos carnosus]